MSRIHVLGVGAIGTLVAHQLLTARTASSRSLTLLLKSQSSVDAYHRAGSTLKLSDATRRSGPSQQLPPCRAEAEAADSSSLERITTLLTTLKCPAILPALRQLSYRLDRESTVVLLHNGMGVHEQLVRDLWPDTRERPALVQGITSVGARSLGPYEVQIEGRGAWDFAPLLLADQRPPASLPSTVAALKSLARAPGSLVEPTFVPLRALQEKQFLKLAVNAAINPLTALFRIPNGTLVQPELNTLLNLLVAETSSVLLRLTDAQGQPLLPPSAFSASALKEAVLDVARKTASNRSSMLQDVDAGRPTEVDFINGHLVALAADGQGAAPLNALLTTKIEAFSAEGRGPTGAGQTVGELVRDFESLSIRP